MNILWFLCPYSAGIPRRYFWTWAGAERHWLAHGCEGGISVRKFGNWYNVTSLSEHYKGWC